MNKTPIFEVKNLTKTFEQGEEHLNVLQGVNLQLYPGEVVALVGSSGSGKSTLLHTSGLLERPTSGQVLIEAQDAWKLSEEKRAKQRREKIGFVYQFHHLLPEFTALENVMMPLIIQGVPQAKAIKIARKYLGSVGMTPRETHRPSRLSGGEQQRVAILRALVTSPRVLLADEPTGNLDAKTSDIVFQELLSMVREHKIAALIATHDLELAKRMDRIFTIDQGVLTEQK